MCGFIAVVGKHVEKSRIENALHLIRHRGPDGSGIWQDESSRVSLGHTRLSIIDLEGGKQPISNHDGSLHAVVNGEFYDYQRIRTDLENDGYRFKTHSDSEILLGLYERFGTRLFHHLRGEFAFVLWDQNNRLVFAARDYFGVKPLFYAQDNEAIYFASEAKALKPLGIPLVLDEENFVQSMCFFPNPEGSLFTGVQQIPPAHYLVRSLYSHHIKTCSYWDFNYPKAHQVQTISEEEAVSGLRDILTESIKTRLRADVPVACYLSGGLDSCSILGIAQQLSSKPLLAFTLGFDHEAYDEEKVAHEMADFAHAKYFPISITQNDIATHFADAVWHAERFFINGHAVAKFLLSKAVHEASIKVVLTGEGSDEIFGGYAFFRQDMIEQNGNLLLDEKALLIDQLRKKNEVSSASGLLISANEISDHGYLNAQLGFSPSWMRNFLSMRPQVWDLLSPSTLKRFGNRNPLLFALNYLDIPGQIEGRDNLSRSLYLWSKLTLPYYLLTVLGDRMEMAHSIEGRVPFLDHKLVEYVVTLPSQIKIKDMTEKYILRHAAKSFITSTVFERQKHPFLAPPASITDSNNAMTTLINDTLRGSDLAQINFVDKKKIVALMDKIAMMDKNHRSIFDPLLLSLLSACLLQKRMATAPLPSA